MGPRASQDLRSPSPIMAPDTSYDLSQINNWNKLNTDNSVKYHHNNVILQK